jgi:hypothetical protein
LNFLLFYSNLKLLRLQIAFLSLIFILPPVEFCRWGGRTTSATPLLPHCFLGYGYIGARTDTTQQSGQTPAKKVEIKNITVYVSDYTEKPDSRGR